MKIGKFSNIENIKFGQNQQTQAIQEQNQVQSQQNYQQVNSIPAQFINANVPVSYTKINEFTYPGTDTKVHIYKLSNGQTIVLAPKKGESQISTYVKCGGMTEPDNISGISHYIEHNLFNGSKDIKPKEFFDTVQKMGAYSNAYTGSSNTCYYIASHLFDSEDLPKIVKMHSDMVQYPKFNQDMLDKEKGIVNSEITMYDDRNSTILLGKALKQLFQIESTSNDLVCGTVKNINNLSREDVLNYYNKNYTPDKMTTVLTGEFNPDEAIKLIANNFTKPAVASQPTYHVELRPIESSKRTEYISKTIDTDEYAITFKGPEKKDLKGLLCLELISDIFANGKHSKLVKALKPFNVTPDFGYDSTGPGTDRPFYTTITGAGNPKYTEQVLQTIFSAIHNSKSENLAEDIEIAKKKRLRGILQGFETGNNINSFLGLYLQNYTPEEICKIPEIVKSITETDIKNAINKYLDLNKASVVVAHPEVKTSSPSFKGKLVKEGLKLDDFTQTKLSNNVEVYLKDDKKELKEMLLNIDCPVSADINPILPDVFAKILSNGQFGQTEEDYSKDLAKRGISYGVSVTNKGYTVAASSLNQDMDYALKRIVDTITCPKFTEQDLQKIKAELTQDIMGETKSPDAYLTNVMFPQLKSAPTKEDKLKALNELKLEDLLGFSQYLIHNGSARFIWNRKDIPYELTRLGNLQHATQDKMKTYIPLQNDVLKVQKDNIGQAKIIQAFKFQKENTPKEEVTLGLLNSILSNGIETGMFKDLREEQKLAYYVRSTTDSFGNTGLIILNTGTTTDSDIDPNASSENITKSLNGFKKHIEMIKNKPVSKEELDAAKLALKSRILSELETTSGKLNIFLAGIQDYNNPDNANYMLSLIDSISPEDIQKLAQKVFAGHSLTSVVANEKAIKELNLHQQ